MCPPHAVGFPLTVLLHLPGAQEQTGLPQCFDASLPACRGLRTPADLHRLALLVVRVLPSLKLSASATSLFEAVPALQGARSPLRPPGYSVYASSILFVVCTTPTPPGTQDSIRVARPCPTRTFTLQESSSLSWRDHALLANRRRVSENGWK